jgi:hypothetical protein
MKIITILGAMCALTGCATASKDIASTYQSPLTYKDYDCKQIAAENDRLQTRAQQLGGRLDEAASNDKKIATAGGLLFWPALFALGGMKQQEAEFATLKGQQDAIQQTAITKNCGTTAALNDQAAVLK